MPRGTDLRIASDTAKLGVQEVKWAIFPGGGSTVRLPRQIPYARAMELLLTGDLITAADALELGFLNHLVPQADVLPVALELADRIAANGPIAVQAIRRSARACLGRPEAEVIQIEPRWPRRCSALRTPARGPWPSCRSENPSFMDADQRGAKTARRR